MFIDRKDAGAMLAGELGSFAGRENVIVLALPRGGVVTGAKVARSLQAPLDILIVRKIGHPWQPELAAGAVSETGTIVYNEDVISSEGVTEEYLRDELARQKEEISRRQQLYRGGRAIEDVTGKTVILVDDGIATGATMKAAVETLKLDKVGKLVVAVPVAPPSTASRLAKMVDVFICLETPEEFLSVGGYYDDFEQVADAEVVKLLEEFRSGGA